MLGFYRDLIALRHSEPAMADPWLTHLTVDYDEEQRWIIMRRGPIAIACNLGTEDVDVPAAGEPVLGQAGSPPRPTPPGWPAIRSPCAHHPGARW